MVWQDASRLPPPPSRLYLGSSQQEARAKLKACLVDKSFPLCLCVDGQLLWVLSAAISKSARKLPSLHCERDHHHSDEAGVHAVNVGA